MRYEKLYFSRPYNQWNGKDIDIIEDEVNNDEGYCLYIQIPDMNLNKDSVTLIQAVFKLQNSNTRLALCEIYDEARRIIKLNMPTVILTNDGLYEVTFTITYNANGTGNYIKSSAIQTFTILDAVEVGNEELDDDYYNKLMELLKEISDTKIDVSQFAKKEEVEQMLEEALKEVDMDTIVQELKNRGYVNTTILNKILKDGFYAKEDIDKKIEDINEDIEDVKINYFNKNTDSFEGRNIEVNGKTLQDIINDLKYKEVEIKSFNTTLESNLVERGRGLYSVTFKWELEGDVESQRINVVDNDNIVKVNNLNKDVRTATITCDILNCDGKFTLRVVDKKGKVKTKEIVIKSVFPSYYGTYENDLTMEDILASNKIIIDGQKNQHIEMTYTNSKVFFAYPKSFGDLVDIKDHNGFSYFDDFIFDNTFSHSGTSYNVYKLDFRASVPRITYSLIFKKE